MIIKNNCGCSFLVVGDAEEAQAAVNFEECAMLTQIWWCAGHNHPLAVRWD